MSGIRRPKKISIKDGEINRLALVVLGMHRSGTSAFTRTASLLGADLPTNLMPPAPGENEKGFWESLDIYGLNDDILESAGSSWDDWRPFNAEWFRVNISSHFSNRASEIIQRDFSSSSLFVLKDPRICLILPFWQQVFRVLQVEIRCLIPFRHPLEVAASLSQRNGFGPLKSQLLWLRHVLDAERDSRHLVRAFSPFDGLLADWRTEIAHISQVMDVAWPRRSAAAELEIDAFLEARLRHHTSPQHRIGAPAPISTWIGETYAGLLELRKDPDSATARDRLDGVRSEFDQSCLALGAVVKEEELVSSHVKLELALSKNQIRDLDGKIEERDLRLTAMTKEFHGLNEKLSELTGELANSHVRIAEISAELAQRDAKLHEVDQHLSQRDMKLSELTGELANSHVRIAEISAELAQRDAKLHEVDQHLSQRDTKLSELNQDLVQREEVMRVLEDDLVRRDARITELTTILTERDTSLAELRVHLDQVLERENRLRAELDLGRQQLRSLKESRGKFLIRLSQIQQRPSWQLSRPIQLIEQRWPGFAEGAAGIAKLAWWSGNLRLSERMRLRRLALELLDKKLFDTDWYVERNPDIALDGLNPIMHWMVAGWHQMRDPCPLFDIRWYLSQRPELAGSDTNPLFHYLDKGAREGLSPHPLFDVKWYLSRNPDVAAGNVNPLVHYLHCHPGERRDPHPLFDTAWYLAQDYEVESKGINALYHYLVWGATGWRNPNQFFDSAWYLEQYPEVAREGLNPLIHYLRWGVDEGKNPGPDFDSSWYLKQHPDIAAERINPLAHYLHQGRALDWPGHPAEAAARSLLINAHIQDEAKQFAAAPPDVSGTHPVTEAPRSHAQFLTTLRASQSPGPFYEEERYAAPVQSPVRVIAFYLPQYHPIPENDANWGRGFTEWTNVTKALPAFPGHYQPRAPGELGYYDLRNPDIQRRQVALAKAHGIGAFCYHHYWFSGKRILRRPIDNHLADSSLDLPFCINWANEPWTACWDGHRESGVLIDQGHSPEDDLAFIRDIEPFLRDERYVRVDGKPLLSVYRPTLFPDMRATLDRWQNFCIKEGVGELFTAMVQSFEIEDPRVFGFDAAIEFPPHNVVRSPVTPSQYFSGATPPQVWSYGAMAQGSMDRRPPGFDWFRGLTMCWDNTPRKAQGWVFQNVDPKRYGEWLESHCRYALAHLPPDRRLIFINAWNEWAEGTYLEPDQHFGYAFLNRTADVLAKVATTLKPPASATNVKAAPTLPLPDYVELRHGSAARDWLRRHFASFQLPFTAQEVHLPLATGQEIDKWIAELNRAAAEWPEEISQTPRVSILLPVFNQVRFTLSCLVSLYTHASRYSFEVLIGDDGSTDETDLLGHITLAGFRYFRHAENLGFLKNCNALAAEAKGDYLVLLNNDTVILPGWLDGLLDTLETNPDIGLVGSKLIYPDGRLQEAGSLMWNDASGLNWGNLCDPQDPEFNYRRDVDYCSGASIALATTLWQQLGGFDAERYQQAYYEDTDLAFRIREERGLRVVYQPLSHLVHFEGISSGRSLDAGIKRYQKTNRPIFVERWRQALSRHGDPNCRPNDYIDRRPGKRLLLIDVVTPLPDQDSGSVDTYNYLRLFERLGFKVTLLPVNGSYMGPYVRDLQGQGIRVLHEPYRGPFEDVLRMEAAQADIIFIYRETAHRYMPLLRALVPRTPIVFNTVDLHFLRKEREAVLLGTEAARLEAQQTRHQELAAMDLANATIVLSQYEEHLLTQLKPGLKVARIPIVREIPGRSVASFAERQDVVFIGGFLHTPNVDAVLYFTREIWPIVRKMELGRPCRFLIAGSNMPAEISSLAADDIIIKGHVPDLAELYDRALISVAPLRYGAGLKGKVVTSLGFGVPVVGSAISLEGSGLIDGQHILAADSPAAMAEAIGRLHANRDLWDQLSDAGLTYAQEQFSLNAVQSKLTALLQELGVLTISA